MYLFSECNRVLSERANKELKDCLVTREFAENIPASGDYVFDGQKIVLKGENRRTFFIDEQEAGQRVQEIAGLFISKHIKDTVAFDVENHILAVLIEHAKEKGQLINTSPIENAVGSVLEGIKKAEDSVGHEDIIVFTDRKTYSSLKKDMPRFDDVIFVDHTKYKRFVVVAPKKSAEFLRNEDTVYEYAQVDERFDRFDHILEFDLRIKSGIGDGIFVYAVE